MVAADDATAATADVAAADVATADDDHAVARLKAGPGWATDAAASGAAAIGIQCSQPNLLLPTLTLLFHTQGCHLITPQ